MGFLWVTGFSFFHCVASPFHSFVTTSSLHSQPSHCCYVSKGGLLRGGLHLLKKPVIFFKEGMLYAANVAVPVLMSSSFRDGWQRWHLSYCCSHVVCEWIGALWLVSWAFRDCALMDISALWFHVFHVNVLSSLLPDVGSIM